jgi:hypothetical protein
MITKICFQKQTLTIAYPKKKLNLKTTITENLYKHHFFILLDSSITLSVLLLILSLKTHSLSLFFFRCVFCFALFVLKKMVKAALARNVVGIIGN